MEEEDEVALVADGRLLLPERRAPQAPAGALTLRHSLMAEFERRALGGVRFLQGVTTG